MKLNPPASSSDIDAARVIARRLHRRALGHERATDTPPEGAAGSDELGPPISVAEPPAPEAPESAPVAPAPYEPVAPEVSPFESAAFAPAAPDPSAFEPSPVEPAVSEDVPVEPPDAEPAPVEPAEPEATPFDGAAPFDPAGDDEAPSGVPEVSEDPDDVTDSPAAEPGAFEETPTSSDPWAPAAPPTDEPAPWDDAPEGVTAPAQIDPDSALAGLGGADAGPALEGLEPPATGSPEDPGSPADLVGDTPEPEWPETSPLDADQEPERAPDDLVSPAGPSWDDVADSCLALARVHGAMLVAPEGQVLAARGTWPEPGPEAIGGRLVSMMEKTLHGAPTRSVSAPLAGQHLTAWRVPAGEGYYTVVFMGDAPLGADVRSPVDVEIKRALGQ